MNIEPKPVICCGFTPCIQRMLEFDQLSVGAVNRAVQVTIGVGGKGTNTARMVNTLGGNSLLLGFSGGETGKRVEKLLVEEGINFRFVHVAEETRTCQTLVVRNNPESTELVEEAPPIALDDWERMVELFNGLGLSGAIVAMSGKLPTGIPSDAYAQLTKVATAAGATVIVDASDEPLLQCLAFSPALIKINEAELRRVSSGWENPVDGCHELIEQGARAVLVTRGADSAFYVDKQTMLELFPPEVKAVNPIGSGDAVTSGIAFELSRGAPLEEALITGMACGIANALERISGSLQIENVKRLRSKIRVIPAK